MAEFKININVALASTALAMGGGAAIAEASGDISPSQDIPPAEGVVPTFEECAELSKQVEIDFKVGHATISTGLGPVIQTQSKIYVEVPDMSACEGQRTTNTYVTNNGKELAHAEFVGNLTDKSSGDVDKSYPCPKRNDFDLKHKSIYEVPGQPIAKSKFVIDKKKYEFKCAEWASDL